MHEWPNSGTQVINLMQTRTSFMGRFLLLPLVLLAAARLSGTPPMAPNTGAESTQDGSEAPAGSGTYKPAFSWWGSRGFESTPSGSIQVLAQNKQPAESPLDQPAPSGEEKLDLNDQVIRDVFEPLHRGLDSHNLYQVLAVFDQESTPDYAQVRDQLRAFFDQFDAIRFRYQLLQATSDKNHGSAVAEIEMEATPADPSQVTLRREIQMRFRMNLGPKGWRLVGFAPADFFAQ